MSNPNVTVNRHKYTGGSDLPNILGLNSKYGKSVFEFAKEKAGIIVNPFTGNQFTRYGQLMEPVIRDYINSLYNAKYLEDTIIDTVRMYRGNTDGLDREAAYPVLEVKTFGEELDVAYYTPQCQFYMETFNVDKCLLVGYKRPKDFYSGIDYDLENDDSYFNLEFDESNIVTHVIERDPKLWAKIEERINCFKIVVEVLKDNNDMTEEQFNTLFYGGDVVAMTNKVAVLEHKLNDFKEIEKEYKELKDKLYKIFEEKELISFETDAIKITKVAPTSYETVGIDAKKLKENEPDIYEAYKTTKTTKKKGYVLITNKRGK